MRTLLATPARLLAVGAVLMLATACGEADTPAAEPDAPTDGDEVDAPADDAVDDALVDQVAAAVDLAAAEAEISVDDVEVVSAESVTWSDGAIGCPQPGEMYTQALVEGYRIELSVEGETVHYHGANGDEPFRCDDPEEPAEGGGEVS